MVSSSVENLILEIDNSSVTDYKLKNGFILWAQVRYSLYKELMLLKQDSSHGDSLISRSKHFFVKLLLQKLVFVISHWYEPKRKKKYDCLIFNSSAACYKDTSGVFKSKVNGFFANFKHLRILNFFQVINGTYYQKYNAPFLYHEVTMAKAGIKASLSEKVDIEDVKTIQLFIAFLKEKTSQFLVDSFYTKLFSQLMYFTKNHYKLCDEYYTLLKDTAPKFVVIEDANYGGGDKATLVWCANNMGITTIEVQHGTFDVAFCYGTKLIKDVDFSKHKTSVLLTMGRYWSSYAKISSRIYAIGYPYLEEKVKSVFPKDANTILFISQGAVTKELWDIAISLSKNVANKIIYRLHPNEIIDTYPEPSTENLVINKEGDLYELLASSSCVVGSYSTVLFEALLFEKSIFIHRNNLSDEYMPESLGMRFNSAQDLAEKLSYERVSSSDIDLFWALGWEKNLANMNQIEKLW
ncbi:MAG: hypothetical protein Q8K64_13635 [Sediminibacterium sp.]|nr:hypothetical protein [Sediminibacterium sp.]